MPDDIDRLMAINTRMIKELIEVSETQGPEGALALAAQTCAVLIAHFDPPHIGEIGPVENLSTCIKLTLHNKPFIDLMLREIAGD